MYLVGFSLAADLHGEFDAIGRAGVCGWGQPTVLSIRQDSSGESLMTEQSIPVTVPAQGKSRLLILGVGTAILVAVFTLVWLQSAKYEPLAVGKPAPDFCAHLI